MSRIEKAIERANQLRQDGAVSLLEVPPVHTPQPGPGAHVRPVRSKAIFKISSDNPLLVSLNDPNSPVAEEFRKMKSVLVKMTHGPKFRNSLMVTSSVPGEGKSLTAINLAISLAQEYDHTVLLVDADLRRPAVHTYLNMENGRGLSECLVGEADLSDVIIPTSVGQLSIVTSGRSVNNPAEVISSNRMKALFEEMKHRYPDRYIIFDTPPLLPFAEALSLAHMVDGVVFVVKEQLATQANVSDALESLQGCGILGVVYNDASIAHNVERYYSYRNYAQPAA